MRNQERLLALIKQSQVIVLTTHIHPDADGIGSLLALGYALLKMGKDVYAVTEEAVAPRYRYLDPKGVLSTTPRWGKRGVDLFIVLDSSLLERIGTNVEKFVSTSEHLFFIDHHPHQEFYRSTQHCIEKRAAATGEMVAHIIKKLRVKFDQQMALCLYTAIIIDTSSFRYPTVTSQTHRLIGELLKTGINPARAYDAIYSTKRLEHMHLLGEVMSRAKTNSSGEVAWITITEQQMKKYKSHPEDTASFINYLLILHGVKVACLFRRFGRQLRVSLRSAGHLDVRSIAEFFGGGGHSHSSAFLLQLGLTKAIAKVVRRIEKEL